MITPKELENEIDTFVERYSYNTNSVDIALNYCTENYKKLYDLYFQLIKNSNKLIEENQTITSDLYGDENRLTNCTNNFTYLFEPGSDEVNLLNKKFEEAHENNEAQDNFIINSFLEYVFYVISEKQKEIEIKKEIKINKNINIYIPLPIPTFQDFLVYDKGLTSDNKNYAEIIENLKSISNDSRKEFLNYISDIVNIVNEENDNK